MTDAIIEVENLGKRYFLDHQQEREQYKALRDVLTHGVKSVWNRFGKAKPESKEEFWALKDVSFEVKRGEVVGIIGRNGAGKSTLLKILSRITEPTTGRVRLKGRVASLLEVGTGFHPELTGRENIYLNGAVLGMMREEIDRKFDEIVAFAEIEKFLDTPVKRYSSGMYVRLAFAVAAHLEPEILVVDEVLAVGDVNFQKKCLGKMGDVASKEGRTVLFVSHNMSAISSLCPVGIFLEKGQVKNFGNVQNCINAYLEDNQNITANYWKGCDGNTEICLLEIAVMQESFSSSFFFTHQETKIRLHYEIFQPLQGLIIGIRINSLSGNHLAYARIDDYLVNEDDYSQIGRHTVEVIIPANLFSQGKFTVNVDMGIHNVRRIVDRSLNIQFVNTEGIGRKYLIAGVGCDDIFRPRWVWKLS